MGNKITFVLFLSLTQHEGTLFLVLIWNTRDVIVISMDLMDQKLDLFLLNNSVKVPFDFISFDGSSVCYCGNNDVESID